MNNRFNNPDIDQVLQIDLVDYLSSQGHEPVRISGNDYWYLSPLADERTASFKVNRKKNVWYDHGRGTGGGIIHFLIRFHGCTIKDFIEAQSLLPIAPKASASASKIAIDPDRKIEISAIRQLTNNNLLNYLKQRKIPSFLAAEYCREIWYTVDDRKYFGIGFKNDANGYEVRSAYSKICLHPKAISTFKNGSNILCVFEGFFDFLSFMYIHPPRLDFPLDFLILNGIALFEKSRPIMESYQEIKLFLDRDTAGLNYTEYACSISPKYRDESSLYSKYKDMNDWLVNFGKSPAG
ncbi:toprim domain-containing protein [Chitinophaga sancti]|uniref:toprim domain-containing protein n=1 Tax=Chitinophaga sancti TaxID=1004 RepID=UPI002A7635D3|nr:toprim domain-containing protein [Chitinophaga sancti]WPQ61895.1 toprim domain-containing protein [Chitinophaga sancti]